MTADAQRAQQEQRQGRSRRQRRRRHQEASAADAAIVAAAAGVSGTVSPIRLTLIACSLVAVCLAVWGYQHAHTAEFKIQCAAVKQGLSQMNFPDNMLCAIFGNPVTG